MSQPQDFKNQKDPQQPSKNILHCFKVLIREILAVLFWVYVITKLFIFDIDIFLVKNISPNYIWLTKYKFFILIGILGVVFLFTKNKHILLWSLFIFFYPVILIFWRIPELIFRKNLWNLLFAFIDSIFSSFKSFKLVFIVTSFFLISIAIVLVASNKILLWISLIVLLAIQFWAYVQKIIQVFKPSGVYQAYSTIFSLFGEFVRPTKPQSASTTLYLSEKELELPLEKMDENQIQKWTNGVSYLALFNRICLFVAKKIKSYQDNRFNIISAVFGILILVLFTVFSFALVNFGLYKINQYFFSYNAEPTFFNFIYYSFNNFVNNRIQEIIAIAPIAQVASMTESFFALFLVAIFISLVLSFRSQRETDEMNNVIKYLKEEGIKTEEYLKYRYKLNTVEEAMQVLQELDSIFTRLLDKITKTILS